jgi:hypothetical protein
MKLSTLLNMRNEAVRCYKMRGITYILKHVYNVHIGGIRRMKRCIFGIYAE